MEHHKCKLFQEGKLYDDQADCWFEIIHEGQIIYAEGEIESTNNLMNEVIALRDEFEMFLDDGRRGKILITHMGNDPKRASFKTTGPLK